MDLLARAREIRSLLLRGEIPYEQAREMLRPHVEEAVKPEEKKEE